MGMALEISRDALALIRAEAAARMPQEACGLLFGSDARIERASATANVAAEPLRHFEIDPVALFAALKAERAGGERLIGYWHSHPGGDVRPSATDAAMAAPDGKLWLIATGETAAAWRAGADFEPVTLVID